MVEIKFCGMTRAADVRAAAQAGAAYVGVVFAGGARRQTLESAANILADAPPGVRRVGVFGADQPAAIAAMATTLGLDVVQLHGDPTPEVVAAMRAAWDGQLWAAMRMAGAELPARSEALFAAADAVLLDAKVDGALGGTGVALAWGDVAVAIEPLRGSGGARVVLAGGLTPENVAAAVRAMRPNVVDVSSGIESTVGIKDPARMRAFRDAVRSTEGGQ